ncbi:MAG: hypothetical protein COA78_11340 [Blastopirellula sp.]|nr:MAG: hypothetical protein COA78_11340 [Blastopirellula sp.]
MSTENRTSIRLEITPLKTKASLRVGKQRYATRMLNESMAGFGLTLDLPLRQLAHGQFKSEEDCALFGEIATLAIQKLAYEIQIVSVVPFEEEDGPRIPANHIRLRLGVRIIREIPDAELRTQITFAQAIAASIALFLCIAGSTGYYYQEQIAHYANNVSFDWKALQGDWTSPQPSTLAITDDQLLIEQSDTFIQLSETLQQQPAKLRIQRIQLLQDKQALDWLKVPSAQANLIRQITMESKVDLERIWKDNQADQTNLEKKILAYLKQLEAKLLVRLNTTQAKQWIEIPLSK